MMNVGIMAMESMDRISRATRWCVVIQICIMWNKVGDAPQCDAITVCGLE